MENSQQSCQPFPPLTNYTQAPLPSIATLNVASAIRHYLLQKSASISDTEEILKFINVRGSIANTLVSNFYQEPPQICEAMTFAELVMARSRGQVTAQNQVWVPRNDKPLFVSLLLSC